MAVVMPDIMNPSPAASNLPETPQMMDKPCGVIQIIDKKPSRISRMKREIGKPAADVFQRIPAPGPPVKSQMIKVRRRDPALPETEIYRVGRPAFLVFLPRKSFFLSGGDNSAVADQCR
jgi:hypothetical protein